MAMKGKDAHLRRLKKLSDPTGPANQVLQVLAEKIRTDAKNSLTTNSASGQSGGKHQHIPSRPGEPPNNEFGGLSKGIIEQTFPLELRAEVRAETEYSAPLEYGTSKMAERPFMRPARDKNLDFAKRLFAEKMSGFVKGSGK